jgi:hypothetical protein
VIVLGRSLWRQYKYNKDNDDPMRRGVFAGWVALVLGSFGANTFSLPAVVVYFWTASAFCLNRNAASGKDDELTPQEP